MMAYAGIGSRRITEEEKTIIENLARQLSKDFIVYSGNADGADIAFQTGSDRKCVIMLPWTTFNSLHYNTDRALDAFSVGKLEEGQKAIEEFHPAPDKLSQGARLCIARNYYQIHGFDDYPPIKFVVCCSDTNADGEVIGGTGHAVRIAKHLGVPVFNIRELGWDHALHLHISEVLSQNG